MESDILDLVKSIASEMTQAKWRLATAESCTGGGIASTLTELAGSSDWFEGGIVSYSNQIKHQLLGISEATLEKYGAVSEQVAVAMVSGVIATLSAQVAVSVTGIAGPGGGSVDKPVGTVWIAWKTVNSEIEAEKFVFKGNRSVVRKQTISEALKGLIKRF